VTLLSVLVLVVSAGWIVSSVGPWAALSDLVGPDTRWATVTTDVLNVRAAPTTDSEIVDAYEQGQRVEVLGGGRDGFVPVRHGNGQAWMAVAYLTFDGGAPGSIAGAIPVQNAAAASGGAGEESPPPADETVSIPIDEDGVDPGERWIGIDRGTATVTLYEGDVAIASFAGRIGRDPSADGFYATAIGTYHVYSMNKGLAPTPFAEDTWLTDWVGFDPVRKNGIHSPVRDAEGNVKPWQNPTTLGCVRLEADDAATVFEFAHIGMRVEVHD
jgi:hypothetical protein